MKYLFDACISFKLARMLSALDCDVAALREVLPEDTADLDIFADYLKSTGRVWVTNDSRQRSRQQKARALKECGATALFFGPWGKKKFWDQAAWLVSKWPIIDGYVTGAAPGTCAEISQNGKARAFTL